MNVGQHQNLLLTASYLDPLSTQRATEVGEVRDELQQLNKQYFISEKSDRGAWCVWHVDNVTL